MKLPGWYTNSTIGSLPHIPAGIKNSDIPAGIKNSEIPAGIKNSVKY
jgi:hypothetical protein